MARNRAAVPSDEPFNFPTFISTPGRSGLIYDSFRLNGSAAKNRSLRHAATLRAIRVHKRL